MIVTGLTLRVWRGSPPNDYGPGVEIRSAYSSSSATGQARVEGHMQYMLLIYNCERPEPDDPGFAEALARVNAFADECRSHRAGRGAGADRPDRRA
jgi:hypothetical protein